MVGSVDIARIFGYINDVLQSIIVIFGAAVVLYNIPRLSRGAVPRTFSILITFVVLVYLTELLVSRSVAPASADLLLRIGWIGIAMVPAAQFHLSDALLTTTGKFSPRRRRLVILGYLSGTIFVLLGVFTSLIVSEPLPGVPIPQLTAGPYFLFFAGYFWLLALSSVYNVWRARQRCLTTTTRRRMTTTLIAILAAPLGVFPYTLIVRDPLQELPLLFWPIIIAGNLIVSILFAFLTSQLVYFGSVSPDRVVRVRLYKYMARVPLAATILLLVYVLVGRAPPILGLPKEVALGFAAVATVMIVEWVIHQYKSSFERAFQLNDDPDVRRIQTLSERLLTTSDLKQFLESVLAATVEALRTPSAFIAAFTSAGVSIEAVVGPPAPLEGLLPVADLQKLALPPGSDNGSQDQGLETVNSFFVWKEYWIQPLYNQGNEVMLGILGIRARGPEPDLSPEEIELFNRLKSQASAALEDRLLQLEVFSAVERILPQLTALQERRSAATFGGLPVLAGGADLSPDELLQDPEFSNMVRDALTHYWGGPKLTESPLLQLQVVQRELEVHDNNPVNALRAILAAAIDQQRPEGQRSLTTTEWILYNILDLKFVQGRRVRDVARRLAMSESDLYRKQRVAVENVARTIAGMERAALNEDEELLEPSIVAEPNHIST
jgi:GAF domain-containing protein